MNVIFLDIDGVLNSQIVIFDGQKQFFEDYPNPQDRTWENKRKYYISPPMVSRLNEITKHTTTNIVLSSTWRILFKTPQEADDFFKSVGVLGDIISFTSTGFGGNRGKQIGEWIQQNGVKKFLILDDETSDMDPSLLPHIVKTKYCDHEYSQCVTGGLQKEHIEIAIEKWRNQ